jgi:hypothetical protein
MNAALAMEVLNLILCVHFALFVMKRKSLGSFPISRTREIVGHVV